MAAATLARYGKIGDRPISVRIVDKRASKVNSSVSLIDPPLTLPICQIFTGQADGYVYLAPVCGHL